MKFQIYVPPWFCFIVGLIYYFIIIFNMSLVATKAVPGSIVVNMPNIGYDASQPARVMRYDQFYQAPPQPVLDDASGTTQAICFADSKRNIYADILIASDRIVCWHHLTSRQVVNLFYFDLESEAGQEILRYYIKFHIDLLHQSLTVPILMTKDGNWSTTKDVMRFASISYAQGVEHYRGRSGVVLSGILRANAQIYRDKYQERMAYPYLMHFNPAYFPQYKSIGVIRVEVAEGSFSKILVSFMTEEKESEPSAQYYYCWSDEQNNLYVTTKNLFDPQMDFQDMTGRCICGITPEYSSHGVGLWKILKNSLLDSEVRKGFNLDDPLE